ncbi:hypothetical protein [Acinetobacter zhairhuonensis]|uniref:hypothetical protein n=1 Tax=Acinetobacter sp. A7.4 TaxID=2919921 RepID=UPI001F4F4DE1|nr:hypothetical protein [Acinetobacter sp. A7.4]MCJ8161857.1 hypothetical protein [Acinetobacter sp. A7.4]
MATDVDVQYFSHLNGLTLGNNWGDLIRLLDKALVAGIELTQITSASIDEQGDIHLTLYAAHNCMLFQIIELSDFADVSVDGVSRHINGKYRIKGVPVNNQLILKGIIRTVDNPPIVNISSLGSAKLASLGYDRVFRDTNDVKRVYRAKDPSAAHPFIRVDESLTSPDGTSGVYTSTYAKSAMVGLIENMTHIDDYTDTSKVQLPLSGANVALNFDITGTGTGVTRGWSKWYWTRSNSVNNAALETAAQAAGNRAFTLIGDRDAFYFIRPSDTSTTLKMLSGCGLFDAAHKNDVVPNWFLMTTLYRAAASATVALSSTVPHGGLPFALGAAMSRCFLPRFDEATRISDHVYATPQMPDFRSGNSNLYSPNNLAALQIPLVDQQNYLRGTLKHVYYNGKNYGALAQATPILSDTSMYVADGIYINDSGTIGSPIFYLGEIE